MIAARHGKADAAVERLFRAYFTEGLATGEPETLAELGGELGLPADEVDELLASDEFTSEVRADEQRAAQLGIGGVPFFAIDGRYGVSGAQSVDVLLEALTAAKVPHEGHIYKNANHGFHNDTTPRYDEAAAKEAWQHTLDWFSKYLGAAKTG